MLTASAFLDQLGMIIRNLGPAPPGTWVQITEVPGETPNWFANVTKPLSLPVAEAWISAVEQLRTRCPQVDFAGANEDHRGSRGLTKLLIRIHDDGVDR